MTPRDVVILGSTGSIGTQALDLVRGNPDRFRVVGADRGRQQPGAVRAAGRGVRAGVPRAGRGRHHRGGRRGPATSCSTASPVPSGCGRRWPRSTPGNTLALANKESLIMGGPLVTGAREARPDRAGRLRAPRARPVPARRPPRGGTPPGADRQRRAVPRPHPRRAADVTPEQALAHPTWDMGPVHHDQLRDPGQQGARGDRGTPAVRHPVRPDRGRGAPDQRRALDGGVRRRLDAGAGQPADHADPDRARRWAGRTGSRTPRRPSTGRRPRRGSSSRSTTRRSRPWRWPAAPGERGGTAPAVYNAANEVCVEAFRAGRLPFVEIVPTIASVAWASRRTLGGRAHRRRRPRRRRAGPGPALTRLVGRTA